MPSIRTKPCETAAIQSTSISTNARPAPSPGCCSRQFSDPRSSTLTDLWSTLPCLLLRPISSQRPLWFSGSSTLIRFVCRRFSWLAAQLAISSVDAGFSFWGLASLPPRRCGLGSPYHSAVDFSSCNSRRWCCSSRSLLPRFDRRQFRRSNFFISSRNAG